MLSGVVVCTSAVVVTGLEVVLTEGVAEFSALFDSLLSRSLAPFDLK